MVAESVPLVIVGAGEAALHVLERLPDRLLKKTVVLAGAEGQGRRGGPRFRGAATSSPGSHGGAGGEEDDPDGVQLPRLHEAREVDRLEAD